MEMYLAFSLEVSFLKYGQIKWNVPITLYFHLGNCEFAFQAHNNLGWQRLEIPENPGWA